MSLRMPAEHGAWGILLVPYVCAAALAGNWSWPVALAGICALSLFLLRGSVEAQGGWSWTTLRSPAHLILGHVGAISATSLILRYDRGQLIWLGLVALGLYALQRRLGAAPRDSRKEKRSLAAELIGVVLLTLAAPAAWIAARGAFDLAGLEVWALSLAFFLGGVLYVKYRVRAIAAHRPFAGVAEKLAFAWPVVVYHLLLLSFLICLIALDSFPLAVLAAFVPGILRANALLLHLGRRFPIRRLGWTEVAHSVVFAALLILTFSP